jgi:hypothetical protein
LVDAGVVKTTQSGIVYGAGIGLRLVFLTGGARFRLGNFPDWQLWTLDAELGIHIPLGAVEPYFTFGGGYASMGDFSQANVGSDFNNAGVSISGWNLRMGGGLDIYLSHVVSIGGNVSGDVMFLSRPGVSASNTQTGGGTLSAVYDADGSSIGAGVTFTGVVGLHF